MGSQYLLDPGISHLRGAFHTPLGSPSADLGELPAFRSCAVLPKERKTVSIEGEQYSKQMLEKAQRRLPGLTWFSEGGYSICAEEIDLTIEESAGGQFYLIYKDEEEPHDDLNSALSAVRLLLELERDRLNSYLMEPPKESDPLACVDSGEDWKDLSKVNPELPQPGLLVLLWVDNEIEEGYRLFLISYNKSVWKTRSGLFVTPLGWQHHPTERAKFIDNYADRDLK